MGLKLKGRASLGSGKSFCTYWSRLLGGVKNFHVGIFKNKLNQR